MTTKYKPYVLAVFSFALIGALSALFYLKGSDEAFRALVLQPSNALFPNSKTMNPTDIRQLVQESSLEPQSSPNGAVAEPQIPDGHSIPPEADALGFGSSQFLVDTRWATIRFVGPAPAGIGLSGEALNLAQLDALGLRNDSIPVITTAATVTEMMDKFFVPLFEVLPGFAQLLEGIKVQGAYFSPDHRPSNGEVIPRDNAYVVGLQSMFVYPSSCFENGGDSNCKAPFFSTGHDPTVIGHELGHVIFNHVRREKSLDGFQWFAVNEGYADYFSAAFFSEPVLGRIWRVTRGSAPYLRNLLDNPNAGDKVAVEDAHRFSVVWSSALWRIRNRLTTEHGVRPADVDKTMLFSILFLGETQKTRLGDAATAVLKAAETLGYPEWKEILKSEFENAEISLAAVEAVKISPRGRDLPNANTDAISCGIVGASSGKTSSALALLPLAIVLFLKFRTRALKLILLCFAFFPLQGCNLFKSRGVSSTSAPGLSLNYVCTLEAIGDDSALAMGRGATTSTVTLTDVGGTEKVANILVSDDRYERSQSAMIFIVDKEHRRVDQVRTRDGNPFQGELVARAVTKDEALSYMHVRAGFFLLDSAAQALASFSGGSSASGGIGFVYESRTFLASKKAVSIADFPYGPLPETVERHGVTICSFENAFKKLP